MMRFECPLKKTMMGGPTSGRKPTYQRVNEPKPSGDDHAYPLCTVLFPCLPLLAAEPKAAPNTPSRRMIASCSAFPRAKTIRSSFGFVAVGGKIQREGAGLLLDAKIKATHIVGQASAATFIFGKPGELSAGRRRPFLAQFLSIHC